MCFQEDGRLPDAGAAPSDDVRAHLSYDIRFLMDHAGWEGIPQKVGKTPTASCFRMHRFDKIQIMVKDTLFMINKLSCDV